MPGDSLRRGDVGGRVEAVRAIGARAGLFNGFSLEPFQCQRS
jgi:hypothetical protein